MVGIWQILRIDKVEEEKTSLLPHPRENNLWFDKKRMWVGLSKDKCSTAYLKIETTGDEEIDKLFRSCTILAENVSLFLRLTMSGSKLPIPLVSGDPIYTRSLFVDCILMQKLK